MQEMTVEQKFAKLLISLRVLRPFYSAIYEVMEKHESNSIPTVGVTTNKLIYNKKFIDEREFSELIFIMLHEICHIALQHVARREDRDATLWNIAADLYSNAMLVREFGFNNKISNLTTVDGIAITVPYDGLFCSSIDIDEDFTEGIYEELEKQGKQNGYIAAKNGHGNTKPGQTFHFEYHGSIEDKNSFSYSNSSIGDTTFKFDIPLEGTNIDLLDNGESQSAKQQQADKIVADAVVRVDMNGNWCGRGSDSLLTQVKRFFKSELDWKKLLRKYLIAATSSDSSFANPDKRMYYQKMIYPGQILNDAEEIKGVKVCIDTSGSISDDDIKYFCGQVYQLTKQFKVDAELIYWDTAVQSTGSFTGYREFERIDIVGRGGTDPSVVFNYFDSKQCKIKPIVTLMFTDAYFSVDDITAKQRKMYKDTIWVMTRNHNKEFVPPFGKKAVAKFK